MEAFLSANINSSGCSTKQILVRTECTCGVSHHWSRNLILNEANFLETANNFPSQHLEIKSILVGTG